ncbi:MAG: DUF1002 domain-containing protein [Lachnospiraceae bacterium]|nr:DUF1002 domain-containing protein [Lachnospiraceae bacterium]
MKKLMSLLLVTAMTIGMTVSAAATETIVIENQATPAAEPTPAATATPTPTPTPAATATPTPTPTPAPTAGASADNAVQSGKEISVTSNKTYLALGSDLTAAQRNTVLSLMGIAEADLPNYDVVYVTNAEEHQRLNAYIDSAVIGTRSLSSVVVRAAEAGHGVTVTTKNINYCTENMYRNALITAGVEDADIMVVAPSPISGTAALIGALKAYERMSGTSVSDKALDTALNELVTTGQISEAVGNDAKAEEIISYVKAQIAANHLETEEEIEAAIRQGMKDLNVELSEEDIKSTVKLMMKIKAMGIDFNVLAEQAEDIYAKYKDKINAGTFNINDVSIEDLGLGKLVKNAVGGFFKDVGDTVKSFFGGLFSKWK